MIDPEKSNTEAIKELREQVEKLTKRVGMLEGAQKATDRISNALSIAVDEMKRSNIQASGSGKVFLT